MNDRFNHPGLITNTPELSVSEISGLLKRTVEDAFSHVRVRGEISKVTLAKSGHLYTSLKDADAVLEAVAWKGTVLRLGIKPEEGMEVICTGRITTYPGRSNYQLVIESMELAGQGALLKMIEERKKKLAAEGLFDAAMKKSLPYLPRRIGVVTSPTGAVIRDILHRIADRFPVHVLVWPVNVQGANAAREVTAGIVGFNNMDVPPDLIIVARGGGSIEDLMPFNEEIVVRAAAESVVPLISAVGHETDITLIDFAADKRAPTPTAAAEMAVPVRADILAQVLDWQQRLLTGLMSTVKNAHLQLDRHARIFNNPGRILESPSQKFDRLALKADHAFEKIISNAERKLSRINLQTPADIVESAAQKLERAFLNLGHNAEKLLGKFETRLARIAVRAPDEALKSTALKLDNAAQRLCRINLLEKPQDKLDSAGRMLETLSFRKILARGFAVVHTASGQIASHAALNSGDRVSITFVDGKTDALIQKD